jgi:hypothetical protein
MIYRENNLAIDFRSCFSCRPPQAASGETVSGGLGAQTFIWNGRFPIFRNATLVLALKKAPESCDRDLAV